MSVTYTTAAERDRIRERRAVRYVLPDPLLCAASAIAIAAIALATTGRLRALDEADGIRGAAIVNLNAAREAAALEPALAAAFPAAGDRRFAAQQLVRFLGANAGERRALGNVGAIAAATVETSAIRGDSRLGVFAERLRLLEERQQAPARIALFTPPQIAAIKPFAAVRTRDAFRATVWWFAAIYVLAFQGASLLWRWRRRRSDRLLLVCVHLLTAVGFAVLLSRPDPLRDQLLFVRYAETVAAGVVLMAALSFVDAAALGFASLSYLPLMGALSLSVVLLIFGSGPGASTAKVNLGPFQPIEAIRLLLALFLAGYFARRWELLRGVRAERIRDVRLPRWIDLPRGEYVVPVLVGVGASLIFFFFQKDLGPALFLCCVFLAVYAVARGRVAMAIAGLVLLAAGFYAGYRLQVSATLADRVRMWQSPWDNAVAGGDQITHAVWAMATGGLFGTGLGLGDSRYLPAGHTDLILAAIGEELGAAGLIAVTGLFAVVAWRGFRIARCAASDYGFFLAATLTLFLVLPAIIMAAGVTGLTPLTGVVTPFLSYGGSAMLANFAALGLLAAIRADRRPAGDFTPFRAPMRTLSGVLAICALALGAVVVRVQVLRADELVVKPHLGIHADGGRRFDFNPRVLTVLKAIPRGTIFDRRGIPLASDSPSVLAAAGADFTRIGISPARTCPDPGARCYPLGGEAFHVLGDARTAENWTATNTSYVERDADATLRGFDDHAASVQTVDRAGRPMYTVYRDYSELVPLLRHRRDPEHPAVRAFLERPRDVRLTIDADLQHRVAAIVASHARRAKGKAAAVVLDPDTGAVLASVSYPWPDAAHEARSSVAEDEALLDRARYGAYPPGSTFKLVVALAALRAGVSGERFTCARLADGRVGATIDGWARPIRDDVLDTRPHGTIGMHDGLVHSCNAYFAQLAVRLGAEPIAAVAERLKITLSADGSARRVRETLPQIGYGQAQVVASPLRMATVAAAIAARGLLRPPGIEQRALTTNAEPLLDPAAAARLASDMRDVVLGGTGRSLRGHAWPIAGKTGTAEIARRDSHAWFVGFAPYGPAHKRIAFAVIIEHAGYGGASAAPAAGDIVTAAAAAGLIGK